MAGVEKAAAEATRAATATVHISARIWMPEVREED